MHSVPLLFCPPWINKYYIMDLAPGKSLIEWAVQHGHTCFAISYRNPDASMRDLDFEDYLRQGPLDAVRVVREITGAPEVNTLSVCLGGTLTAIGLAHNAAHRRSTRSSPRRSSTPTPTSATPGALGVFTDEATIAGLEKQMAKKGYLDSDKMAHTFDALRANDLVFAYVVNNWLLGKKPPAFDLLVWNKDSTRMPAKMHSQISAVVLSAQRVRQRRVRGRRAQARSGQGRHRHLRAGGRRRPHRPVGLRLQDDADCSAADNRFVLSTSGHIAGIVNPPSPKAKHWTNEVDLPADPQEWKDGATLEDGTWWEDWATWIAEQGGPRRRLRAKLGSKEHPPIEAAPGATCATARDLRSFSSRTPTIADLTGSRRLPLEQTRQDTS